MTKTKNNTALATDDTPSGIVISEREEFDVTLRAEDLFTGEDIDDILFPFIDAREGETNPLSKEIAKRGLYFKFSRANYGGIFIVIEGTLPKTESRLYGKTYNEFYNHINGMFDTAITHNPKLYNRLADVLQSEIIAETNSAGRSYARIGSILKKMRDDRVFPGGLSIKSFDKTAEFYKYAEETFGYKDTSVKNMINYVERYCITGSGGPELRKEYEGYSYSQLVELQPVVGTLAITGNLPPASSTIKQIREFKESLKGDKKKKEPEPDGIPNAEFEETTAEENADVAERLEGGKPIDADAPGVIRFKNDKEREDFLKNYEKWPLWITVPPLRLWIRRASLSDGSVLLAYMYTYIGDSYGSEGKTRTGRHFQFIPAEGAQKDKLHFSAYGTADTHIIDHIRNNKLFAKI